jgi:hypothetical protein
MGVEAGELPSPRKHQEMTTERQSRRIFFGAALAIAVVGCGGAGREAPGAAGGTQSVGGAAGAGGTGGSTLSGGMGPAASGAAPMSSGGSAGLGAGGSSSGGTTGLAGSTQSGGAPGAAGSQSGAGGTRDAGGMAGTGGLAGGGGGLVTNGGAAGGAGRAGGTGRGGSSSGAGAGGSGNPGTCIASKAAGTNATGSGPHKVTVETNSGDGIKEGTIFRPTDLGGAEKYPIFVWGEGGCSQDGLSNSAAMAEIASYGYFVVADGTPQGSGNRTMDRSQLAAMGAPLSAYIDWAIAENEKPCSAYFQSLAPTKVASNGFSCGGLMSQGTVTDPRIVTWGVNSSGMAGADQSFYDLIHTPVLFVLGGADDIAYDGGAEGYQAVSQLDVPVMWFSKALGHGGDLFQARGGDFTKIDLAWLNWWLKGDETATGKGLLVGSGCTYCSDSAWEVKSAHIP